MRETCRIPVYHAIGNHDVWGWGLPQADTTDPLHGKGMALQALGLAQCYYAFNSGGWRFIVLDSTHPQEIESEIPHTGRLNEEQYAWLETELVATDAATPVCVAWHIPILCACEFFDGDLVLRLGNCLKKCPGFFQGRASCGAQNTPQPLLVP